MGIHELEYRRLLSELKFKNEELEIIEESMRDIHVEFEQYYAEFLKENELSKQELEKTNTKQFQNFKETVLQPQMPETDETGLVVLDGELIERPVIRSMLRVLAIAEHLKTLS